MRISHGSKRVLAGPKLRAAVEAARSAGDAALWRTAEDRQAILEEIRTRLNLVVRTPTAVLEGIAGRARDGLAPAEGKVDRAERMRRATADLYRMALERLRESGAEVVRLEGERARLTTEAVEKDAAFGREVARAERLAGEREAERVEVLRLRRVISEIMAERHGLVAPWGVK